MSHSLLYRPRAVVASNHWTDDTWGRQEWAYSSPAAPDPAGDQCELGPLPVPARCLLRATAGESFTSVVNAGYPHALPVAASPGEPFR